MVGGGLNAGESGVVFIYGKGGDSNGYRLCPTEEERDNSKTMKNISYSKAYAFS